MIIIIVIMIIIIIVITILTDDRAMGMHDNNDSEKGGK